MVSRRPRRRRTRRGWTLALTLVVGLVLVGSGAVWAVVGWLDRTVPIPLVPECSATTSDGTAQLSPEQRRAAVRRSVSRIALQMQMYTVATLSESPRSLI